jgi:hypothetical protein
MRLPAFAELFAKAGFIVMLFDYRYTGASGASRESQFSQAYSTRIIATQLPGRSRRMRSILIGSDCGARPMPGFLNVPEYDKRPGRGARLEAVHEELEQDGIKGYCPLLDDCGH